jgi:ATP-dependent exoDNAse (exonuclease V) alpha subunit
MSTQPDNGQTPPAVEQVAAERDRLREEVERLQAEVLGLKQALAAAQQEAKDKAELAKLWEKDWREICALLPDELRIDPDEIAAMRKNGISFEELIEEIERDLKAREEAGNA